MSRIARSIVVPFKVPHILQLFRGGEDIVPQWFEDRKRRFNVEGVEGANARGWHMSGCAVEQEYQEQAIYVDSFSRLPEDLVKKVNDFLYGEHGAIDEVEFQEILESHPIVFIVDESPHGTAGGSNDYCVFSYDLLAIQAFCRDMEIQDEILENSAVTHTA